MPKVCREPVIGSTPDGADVLSLLWQISWDDQGRVIQKPSSASSPGGGACHQSCKFQLVGCARTRSVEDSLSYRHCSEASEPSGTGPSQPKGRKSSNRCPAASSIDGGIGMFEALASAAALARPTRSARDKTRSAACDGSATGGEGTGLGETSAAVGPRAVVRPRRKPAPPTRISAKKPLAIAKRLVRGLGSCIR